MSKNDPRQGFIAGSLAGMLEVGELTGTSHQIDGLIRAQLDNPDNRRAVEGELAEEEARLAAFEPGSGKFIQAERTVRMLRKVLAVRNL